jgi:RNA polymerase sigma-70 factor (ECF subfamily)
LEEYFSSDEEIGIMSDIINLPEKYKTVILLHYISGYRISEISEIMNLSESAVKMRLKRGREKLKIELEGLI